METTYNRKGTQPFIHNRFCRNNNRKGTEKSSVLDILEAFSPCVLPEKKEKK